MTGDGGWFCGASLSNATRGQPSLPLKSWRLGSCSWSCSLILPSSPQSWLASPLTPLFGEICCATKRNAELDTRDLDQSRSTWPKLLDSLGNSFAVAFLGWRKQSLKSCFNPYIRIALIGAGLSLVSWLSSWPRSALIVDLEPIWLMWLSSGQCRVVTGSWLSLPWWRFQLVTKESDPVSLRSELRLESSLLRC